LDKVHQSQKAPEVLITASAVGFYGGRGDEVVDESSSGGRGFLPEVVEQWEKAWFSFLPQVEQKNQSRSVALRIGMVLGREGGALKEMLPLFLGGVGGKIGNGRQWISWIHRDDLVEMFLFALENPKMRGIYNAVAPHPVRNEDFTRILGQTIHKRTFLSVPVLALKIAFGEMSQVLLDGQKVSADKMKQAGFDWKFENLSSALGEILLAESEGELEYVDETWLPLTPEKIFRYFSDERNLEELTPSWLNFHIVKKSTEDIREGTLIDYQMRLKGVPMKWRTRIEKWSPPHEFVDSQLTGPYSKWYHRHQFERLGSGTLMTDRVRFRLPLGFLGRLFAQPLVSRDVAKIFSHRKQTILSKSWSE
jgi:NAD dependent epimerase/dehydratase family enzyme/ligand-binding SRPBCC domain-containing protein